MALVDGEVVGGVCMAATDPEGMPEHSPWVVGTVVRGALRSSGIGQALMGAVEAWAAGHGVSEAWVSTGRAARFYRRCGWRDVQEFVRPDGSRAVVLSKSLARG